MCENPVSVSNAPLMVLTFVPRPWLVKLMMLPLFSSLQCNAFRFVKLAIRNSGLTRALRTNTVPRHRLLCTLRLPQTTSPSGPGPSSRHPARRQV